MKTSILALTVFGVCLGAGISGCTTIDKGTGKRGPAATGDAVPDDQTVNTVPKCWAADSPNQQIDEGVFILTMPTANHSATDVASVLWNFQGGSLNQTAVGASNSAIEFDFKSTDLALYRPSFAYPTLEVFKQSIIKDAQYRLGQVKLPDVTIRCHKMAIFHRG